MKPARQILRDSQAEIRDADGLMWITPTLDCVVCREHSAHWLIDAEPYCNRCARAIDGIAHALSASMVRKARRHAQEVRQ